jgi:hypothetical protein
MYLDRVQRVRRIAASAGFAALLLGSSLIPGVSGSAAVAGSPCASLTPAAYQQITNTINNAYTSASADAAANGVNGAYAVAAVNSRDYVVAARDKMLYLQSWLNTNNLATPYVTNASAAYSTHGTIREVETALLNAQHWAMISTVYHKSANASATYEQAQTAMTLALALGGDAGRCYSGQYYP